MKAKKVQRKKYRVKKNNLYKYGHEIFGILVFAFGLLSVLSFYFNHSAGILGDLLRSALLGLFGLPSFLIPPGLVVYAFFIIFKKDDATLKLRMLYSLALLVLVAAMAETAFYKPENFLKLTPLNSLYQFFKDGTEFRGGGIFGGIIAAPLMSVLRPLGTVVILTAACVIDIILLTNISIANFITNIKNVLLNLFKKKAEDRKELKGPTAGGDLSSEPGIIGEEENLSLDFETGSKVIDFKIEKTAKELKEKMDSPGKKHKKGMDIISSKPEADELHTELIIKDFRSTAKAEPIRTGGMNENESIKENSAEMAGNVKRVLPGKQTGGYNYPPFDLLKDNTETDINLKQYRNTAIELARKLEETLLSFGVDAKVINISRGPAVTRYELQPSPGVKVSKIVSLSDDIALNLAASGVRIEAPIPGKAAIGIEVPNKEVTPVLLREVVGSQEFIRCPSRLAFALGKDISGESIIADIAKMPHLLIAGATGSGKSVCINSLIISLLYKASPEEVKLLMIDPKVVELGIYNGIPHLLIPVVTDPKKAAGALNWAVQEMTNRYKLFAAKGVRDIKGYNSVMRETKENEPLPQVVIIIDELADLMMVAPNDVEDAICRLAQMARAAGMHLVIATQRPSVDVITGVIKANIPSRISFAVSSHIDSRTILDMAGAEKLLGKGDMLYYPVGEPKPIRVKGAFVTDKEVEKVVEFVKTQGNAEYDEDIIDEINSENQSVENNPGDRDELLSQAIELVVETGQASVSLIQRKLKVGYARAARIIDQMEERGVIGPFEGSKPRQVLISKQQWHELQMADNQ
ncbi:MAG: DNA translocase FtsK [Clostridiales bacterium]|nr:DNA translocase FtsK [Eubacteriales bacterium]MDH7565167.1 DNA translocase FtsK [Clostridiales bacterium]